MPVIYYAGDSTVQYNNYQTYPQTGIGQALGLYLKPSVTVANHGRNGRSTKSFIDESRLIPIYDRITEGDFLFIQFGHNDEKKADPTRYTEPFSDFKVNLGKFIHVARNKKATPVLITPLERRLFDEAGNLKPSEHTDYVLAMKEVAAEQNVALIDLFTMSRELLEKTGEVDSRKWHMFFPAGVYENYPEGKTDNTHLRYEGAVTYAGLIAEGLRQLGGIYRDLLQEDVLFEEETFVGNCM
jgi:lysophospholipase L1-like esterase